MHTIFGTHMLLTLQTHLHRYVASSDPAFQLRIVPAGAALPAHDAAGCPLVVAELGPLLNHNDSSALARRHALLVPLRRRSALLLFDAVGELASLGADVVPLPTLLAARLRHAWVRGVCSVGEDLLLVLDLHAIAQHVAAGATSQSGDRP